MSLITLSTIEDVERLARERSKLVEDLERMMSLTPQRIRNFITYCRSLGGEPRISIQLTEWGAPRSAKLLCRHARIARGVIERIEEREWLFEEEEESREYRVTLVGEGGEKAVLQYYLSKVEVETPLRGSVTSDYVEFESSRLANIELDIVIKKGVDELGEVFYYPRRELKIKIV